MNSIARAGEHSPESKGTSVLRNAARSQWDEALSGVGVDDLALDALARYRDRMRIPDKTNSAGFLKRLERQGFLCRKKSSLVPTGFGYMLFGKTPREVLHHVGLNATIVYPDGTRDIKNFDGPTILIPHAVEAWLKPKLSNLLGRARATQTDQTAEHLDPLYEAVTNALLHRDYDLVGATCHLEVTRSAFTMRSPEDAQRQHHEARTTRGDLRIQRVVPELDYQSGCTGGG